MIYIDLPTGDRFGWGICGDSLTKALATRSPVERLSRRLDETRVLPGPLLQGAYVLVPPVQPRLLAPRRVGYTFFEDDLVAQRAARSSLDAFDMIATGCRWCEDVLREAGLTNVTSIHQGVDAARFHPGLARRMADDRFVVFSGGKFELRKGQDIVVRAFREFSAKHDDVLLLATWHNAFAWSAATMGASPYFPYVPAAGMPFQVSLRAWLESTGVDPRRVELLGPVPNAQLAAVYGRTDVGLFPSRCEGGTNLVLMEYMACGRPAIATDVTGHRDVLTEHNSIRIRTHRPMPVIRDGKPVAVWYEPDLDEIIEALEQAYQQRDRLAILAQRAVVDLADWTWDRAAGRFFELLTVSARNTSPDVVVRSDEIG